MNEANAKMNRTNFIIEDNVCEYEYKLANEAIKKNSLNQEIEQCLNEISRDNIGNESGNAIAMVENSKKTVNEIFGKYSKELEHKKNDLNQVFSQFQNGPVSVVYIYTNRL